MARKTQRAEPKKKIQKKKRSGLKKWFAWSFFAAVLGIVCAMAGYAFIMFNGEKLLKQNINKMDMSEASILYDVNGKEVTALYRENREIVTFDEIPEKLRQAFIATEDRRFMEHTGIDFWSIGRALYRDILKRQAAEGGSTITQQLAKNMFLSSDKTLFRKATEASIAVALENNYSKDEILTLYLNRIFFGNGAYGVKAAAKLYFGQTDLNKLELWQVATLAGIPKYPGVYNPVSNPEKSKERRAVVLKLMADQGIVSEKEREAASAVDYAPPKQANKRDYLTFSDYVMDEVNKVTGISDDELLRGGYKIYTTMDAKAQKNLEQTFAQPNWFQKDGPNQKMQGSMVIFNHQDGGIVAMIGGRDYVPKGLNRALVQRQPGSSFKPLIVYAPAMQTGSWNPYSTMKDEKLTYNGYSPDNYDNNYLGSVNMFYAVKKSINAPAVWLLNEIGVNTGMQFVKNMDIPLEPQDRNLAIALGGLTKGVTPLKMAQAYGAFANNGLLYPAHSVLRILDSDNKEIYRYKPEKPKAVMSAKTAWYMTELLQEVVNTGTGQRAKMDRPLAGKTGSTQLDIKGLEKYDSNVWFVGYTSEWSAAVWLGFDKSDSKHYVTVGSGAAAALFKEVMSKSLAGRKITPFVKPQGVPDLKPPASVSDLTAVYMKEERGVKLTWSQQGENVAFKLYRKSGREDQFGELLRAPKGDVRDISVKPGESYLYYVVPYDTKTNVEGEKSNVAEVVVPGDSSSPSANPQNGGINGRLPGNGSNGEYTGLPNAKDAGKGSGTVKSGTGASSETGAGIGTEGTSGTVPGTGSSTTNGQSGAAGGAGTDGNAAGSGTSGGGAPGGTGGTGANTGTGTSTGTGGVVPFVR